MGDYLGGYFSQKFFDAEIYEIMVAIPEVSSYLAGEWTKFKNDKKNKVPKDAKMSKIWAKKAIFDNGVYRELTQLLILGKYDVEFDENGHITPETKRPIRERKIFHKAAFNAFLRRLKELGKLDQTSKTIPKEDESESYGRYVESIANKYKVEPSESSTDYLLEAYKEEARQKRQQKTPLEIQAELAKQEQVVQEVKGEQEVQESRLIETITNISQSMEEMQAKQAESMELPKAVERLVAIAQAQYEFMGALVEYLKTLKQK